MKYTDFRAKMQEDYDVIAQDFERSRRNMHWSELDELLDMVKPGQAVLDIGCGAGRLYGFLQSKQVKYSGIDVSPNQIKQAIGQYPNADFKVGSMLELPYQDQQFDYVFMVASLHHLAHKKERVKAINEALRVLKPGGKLNITVMNLFKKKYAKLFFKKSAGKAELSKQAQKSLKWNDVFLPWKSQHGVVQRYYHAFTKPELRKLLSGRGAQILKLDYKRQRMNIVAVLQKKI